MSKKKTIAPTPNLIAETVMLSFKIFFAIIVAINVVWAIIYFKPGSTRVGDTHVEITQSGDRDMVKQAI